MMPAPARKLLLVDDSMLFLDLLADFVGRRCPGVFEVAGTATTGEQGLRLAEQILPDVVTVDLRMSGLSGLETIARLRRLLPGAAIIAVTEHTEEPYRAAAIAAGADAFVSKGQLHTRLLPALEQELARHQPRWAARQRTPAP